MHPRDTVKIETEFCSICTHEVPSVCPRQYSQLEIVEDGRGFVAYLRCKDQSACAERAFNVDWAKFVDSTR